MARRIYFLFFTVVCFFIYQESYAEDLIEILNWLENPTDLNNDGVIDRIDIFMLASRYKQPVSDPRQADLPAVGNIEEIAVQSATTALTFDFPTGREAYLLIVRNDSLDSDYSEIAVEDPERSFSNLPNKIQDWKQTVPYSEIITYPNKTRPVSIQSEATIQAIGDRRTFDLYGGSTVTATLRYQGAHAAVYVDNHIWMQGDAQIDLEFVDEQGGFFDETTFPNITSMFGAPGDVNGDGCIAILFTSSTTGQGENGFFFAGDMFQRNELDPSFPTNSMEILYIMPPDDVNDVEENEEIHGVIAHEFQHLINFYYHSLVYGGRNGQHDEERWLDEGLSHLAEDFVRGVPGVFRSGNISRFLDATGTGILADRYVPNTTQRGGDYLLCRYIADRFGDSVLQKLTKTGLQGIANIESAVGTPFQEILIDWSRAVFLSEMNISKDARYNYTSFQNDESEIERKWSAPSFQDYDLSNLNFYGSLFYGYLSRGAFNYLVFRGDEGDTRSLQLLHISGAAPSADVVRLPDNFVYPSYIAADYWETVVLDEPLKDTFYIGEPRVITGRSADGEPLESLRIFYKKTTDYYNPDRIVHADIDGDRFRLTLEFSNDNDVGKWRLGVLPNGASSSIIGYIQVVEP